MSRSVVAIVGRPNVGKSALFNRLVGKRISIVDDEIGVTRDRIYAECEWQNETFLLVDTGGLSFSEKEIDVEVQKQTEFALETSDVIILVVDAKSGLLALDERIFFMLKKTLKSVILCVNKCDVLETRNEQLFEFYSLGVQDIFGVSALHGTGTGDLLDYVVAELRKSRTSKSVEEVEDRINVALIGRPNVGKSTLLNEICGASRSIVSNVAGTTRDPVDVRIDNEFGSFNFIDTAGMRRQSRIDNAVEKFSNIRANLAVERSDVCVIMLDITEEISEQDVRVAGIAYEAGKSCVICVNKSDLLEKNSSSVGEFQQKIKEKFLFMKNMPIVFISAKTGKNLKSLLSTIVTTFQWGTMRISTGELNEILAEAIVKIPPPAHKGKFLKIYFITQSSVKPPTFVVFVNKKKLLHFSYQRYIENCIRRKYEFCGVKLRFVVREKVSKKFDKK